jgi:hypothetical protein
MSWQNRSMSPVEYRRAIHTLHLNKAQAGRFLGYGVRTAHRFWDGDAKVPVSVALLLRALIHFHEQPEVPPYEGIKAKRRRELVEKPAIAP